MSRGIRGFTLIELLVVVAIIVLLIAILLPSLGKAREQGRAAQCASNMHQIGVLINTFACLHDNRGPGSGRLGVFDPQVGDAFVDWADFLNYCLLDENDSASNMPAYGGIFDHPATLYGLRELQPAASYASFMAGKHFLVCPSFEALVDWERVYAINYDVTGGGGYDITAGPYGLAADPRTACSNPNFFASYTAAGGCSYALGAKLSRFGPNQFLVVETQWEDFFPQNGVPGTRTGGTVVLGNSYPFCADGNALAFRHPYAQKANFLFFDAHVEQLTPNDNVDSAMRLRIGP